MARSVPTILIAATFVDPSCAFGHAWHGMLNGIDDGAVAYDNRHW